MNGRLVVASRRPPERMMLDYDAERGCYIGGSITVTASAFSQALYVLVEAGMDHDAAVQRLLDEAEWQGATTGAAAIKLSRTCLSCGQALAAGRERFCTVVCEAEFYVNALV